MHDRINTLDRLVERVFLRQIGDIRKLELGIFHIAGKHVLENLGLGLASDNGAHSEPALEEDLNGPQADVAVRTCGEDLKGGCG